MKHGYDMNEWLDSLSDQKLGMVSQDVNLKNSTVVANKPVDLTNL